MPKLKKSAPGRKGEPYRRIAIKLRIRPKAGLGSLESVNGFGKAGRNLRLLPLIDSVKPKRLREMISEARGIHPEVRVPDFSAWCQIVCPEQVPPDEFAAAIRAVETVETAYVMRPVPPPINSSHRNPTQGYLDIAPTGIGIIPAWDLQLPGCDGAGIRFVDMEQGWNPNHEDLPPGIFPPISGVNYYYFDHGTSVLGEVLMADNAVGGLGIAPAATPQVVSQWRKQGSYDYNGPNSFNNADAIVSAVSNMYFGDVLLLEAQEYDPFKAYSGFWPVEIADATYDAIQLATALGIVVVEAAGNGNGIAHDLNAYVTHPPSGAGKKLFDPKSSDFRDSGAIIVGAAYSATPHVPLPSSNYGDRIDCYAWGEGIFTATTDSTGQANHLYTPPPPEGFGGTSGASAIVAGAALVVQAMAQASLGYRFSPVALRNILKKYGTQSTTQPPLSNPPIMVSNVIGVMPNLGGIITGRELNLAPDLYLRDYVGDTGDPTTGIVSQSPDIIVRQAAVANPQAAYGAGSGTENDGALSQDVAAAQTNFVYARVLNRGGSSANAVEVDLYWSPPATLVTPNLWTKIGTAALPSVATGRVLTVSDAVPWQNPPGPGHYCFVAVAGNAADPKPGISPTNPSQFFKTPDEYITFVENNNNVAWRNFDVVVGPPPPPSNAPRSSAGGSAGSRGSAAGFYVRPFLIPGAFQSSYSFDLEAIGDLPEGSRAFLEMPDWFSGALRLLPCELKRNVETRTARIPLNRSGLQRLGTVVLHPGSTARCRLVVQLPTESRRNDYEFAVRQLYNNHEIGRITWRFAALSKQRLRTTVDE